LIELACAVPVLESKRPTRAPAMLAYYCKWGGDCPCLALSVGLGEPVPNSVDEHGQPLVKRSVPNLPPGMRLKGRLVLP